VQRGAVPTNDEPPEVSVAHSTAPRPATDLGPRRPGLPARCGVRGCGCQETRFGAVFDVVCDRINCVSCALVFLQFVDAPWPIAVFLFQFVVVDLPLTLLPMRWPVLSPNYIFLIDRLAHTLNWHVFAKVTNTTLLVLLLVFVPDQRVALLAASTVLVIKLYSLVRVLRLGVPTGTAHVPQGAAARA
jgi:hypothetical protein